MNCMLSWWDILIFDMWPVHFLRAKFIDFWRGNFSRVRSSTFDMYGPFMNASMCLLTGEGSGIVTECMLIVVVIFVCLSYHGSLHRWWIGSDHFYPKRRSCRCESCRKVVPKRVLEASRRHGSVSSHFYVNMRTLKYEPIRILQKYRFLSWSLTKSCLGY
jgi:hypothetical protein